MQEEEPIRLLMNLSPLGGSFKTGVYRVADELVSGLAKDPRVSLRVHAIDQTARSHEFFRENLSGKASLFAGKFPRTREKLSALLNRIYAGIPASRSIHWRLCRKTLVLLGTAVDSPSSDVPAAILADTQIYHSPFARIPAAIRRTPGIRRFTTVHDLLPLTHPEFFGDQTIRMVRELVDGFTEEDYALCVSEATRKDLLRFSKIRPERALVTHLGASRHFYPATDTEANAGVLARHGIRGPGFILSVCTLEVRKNLQIVVAAFAALHREGRIPADTQLVLVGGGGWGTGKLAAELENAKDLAHLIVFTGFVQDEDLAALYSSAKVFAYMSFAEGFGLPPLEAMQCGTPVITSNASSLPEVVCDAGIMLDPNDLNGLTDAVERIYQNDSLHAELSGKSLRQASGFSWAKHIDTVVGCYLAALPQKQ